LPFEGIVYDVGLDSFKIFIITDDVFVKIGLSKRYSLGAVHNVYLFGGLHFEFSDDFW